MSLAESPRLDEAQSIASYDLTHPDPCVSAADHALALHYDRGTEPLAILRRPPLPAPCHISGYSHLTEQLEPSLRGKLQRLCAVAETVPLRLYLVGGAVRDLLLQIPTSDLDLVVDQGTAAQLAIALETVDQDLKIQRHDRYATAVLTWLDGSVIDVATARRETYAAAAAQPQVVPARLSDDLQRRDFTINALALALTGPDAGTLYDPCGGLADLDAKVVRTLHANSFYEDPTRLVRAARFATRLGFSLAEPCQREAQAAMTTLRDRIWKVSYPRQDDRLKQEWQALLDLDRWPDAIATLARWGGLAYLGATERATTVIAAVGCLHRRRNEFQYHYPELHLIPNWAAVLVFCPPAQELLPQFKFPSQLPSDRLKPSEIVQRWRHQDLASILLWIVKLEQGNHFETLYSNALLMYLRDWRLAKPCLNGNDLMALGYPKGRLYGEILASVLAAQLDGELVKDDGSEAKAEAIAWVRSRFPLPDVDPQT